MIKARLILLASFLSIAMSAMPAAQQTPPPFEETLEKEGCVALENSKVRICKYDYQFKNKRIEAFTIVPLADGVYPGLVMVAGREGARASFNLATLFAQQGFACVAISEPGYGKSEGERDFMGPASIDAFAAGFDKFRQEKFVDKNRMGIFGYSRGGMAASLLTLKLGTKVKAAVFGGGVYDLKKGYEETKFDGIRENIRAETGFTEAALRERSSLFQMEKLKTPVLIIHGAKDENAPTNQALMLRDRLMELRKPFEILILVDHKHGQFKRNFIAPVIDFLRRQLQSGKTS